MLESDKAPHQYYTWNKWGRVGEELNKQNKLTGPMSKGEAMGDFEKKFKDKTKNSWSMRDSFEPKAGKYTLLARDYGADAAPAAAAAAPAAASLPEWRHVGEPLWRLR